MDSSAYSFIGNMQIFNPVPHENNAQPFTVVLCLNLHLLLSK